MNILEDNEDRYDKTIRHKNIRIQCFTISVGLILSYIFYFLLKINVNDTLLAEMLNNKYFLILGQWLIAIFLGNLFSYWYIFSVYKPLLPDRKYTGYSYTSNTKNYEDNVDDYIEHSEVHFGKYWDAEKRRNKIEKIYKVTKIILLVQLVISVILFLILK